MSTQRELVEKFKAAFEEKKFDILESHLAEDMTYQLLPSTFVVALACSRLGLLPFNHCDTGSGGK